jgi:hypothetical protein
MRVCTLHHQKAVDTFVSRKDGVEYDLCQACKNMVIGILDGQEPEYKHKSYPDPPITFHVSEGVPPGTILAKDTHGHIMAVTNIGSEPKEEVIQEKKKPGRPPTKR